MALSITAEKNKTFSEKPPEETSRAYPKVTATLPAAASVAHTMSPLLHNSTRYLQKNCTTCSIKIFLDHITLELSHFQLQHNSKKTPKHNTRYLYHGLKSSMAPSLKLLPAHSQQKHLHSTQLSNSNNHIMQITPHLSSNIPLHHPNISLAECSKHIP